MSKDFVFQLRIGAEKANVPVTPAKSGFRRRSGSEANGNGCP
jgi:hypothetical protein